MAIINTIVHKSHNVKEAALNLNAKAYDVRRTLAAVWDLKPTGVQPPAPQETISLDMKNPGSESVVGGDERVRVADHDIAAGGKYRSIVKIFVHYEFQRPGQWSHGTGWLVKPDVLVTAGHCSYDWSHKLGRATEVKAYIGYKGQHSVYNADVQFRRVKRIVTTEGWVKTKGQKSFDVSFMQVDNPFTGINPISFVETPAQGNLVIGVVGYPADLYDKQTGEHGAYMHEMFLPTQYDLATQADTMLEYQIDTFGGNSGSPVLRQSDLASIGAHVYGGEVNSASVIGRYGNPYLDYLAAFELQVPNDGLNLVPVTGNTTISAPVPSGFGDRLPKNALVSGPVVCEVCKVRTVENGRAHSSQTQSYFQETTRPAFSTAQSQTTARKAPLSTPGGYQNAIQTTSSAQRYGAAVSRKPTIVRNRVSGNEEEGFIDVLKTAASVGANAPFVLGPAGGPIWALASFALNAAGKVAAESYDGSEGASDAPNLHEGSMERAILAEAALMTLQSKEFSEQVEESIFTDMKDSVMKVLPTIRKAAPHVMGAMMEPALRIALDSLHNYNVKAGSGAESFEVPSAEPFRPTTLYSPAIDNPIDARAEAFLANVQASLNQNIQESGDIDGDDEEAWTDVLKAGLRLAGKGAMAAAQHGLPIIVKALASRGGAESAEVGPALNSSHAFSSDALAQRAVVAEAALQAVMKLPPQQLQEEGFFDFISDAVKTIAPIALKVAPAVVSAINPTVGNIVKSVLKQESYAGVNTPSRYRGDRGLASRPKTLAKKTSLAAIRDHRNGTEGGNADHKRRYENGNGYHGHIGVSY